MTGDLSDADLARLAELGKAATQPLWGWRHFGDDPECDIRIVAYSDTDWSVVAEEVYQEADAELIAEARNAIGRLLAEVSAGRDAERRIARVRALHPAVRVPTVGGTEWTCGTCHPSGPQRYDESTWPCPTIRALEGDGDATT